MSSPYERFIARADWDGEKPIAETVRVSPAMVRVPIGGGWSYWLEQSDGAWAEWETLPFAQRRLLASRLGICIACADFSDFGLCESCLAAENARILNAPPDPRRCRNCGCLDGASGHHRFLCEKKGGYR